MAIDSRHLIGREEEVASLLALLDAPDRLPAVAVVAGEAGIGKTTLWLAAVDEASARGFRVISCRPAEAEARFSFSGLVDLLGSSVHEVLPELAGSQQRALEAALALSDSEGPVEEGRVAFAFLSVVRRLAQDGRVLLAVDDLQWLDAPSLALLRYALPRLTSEPVAALLATRGGVPSWLGRSERLLELDLRPLSVGAIHEVLRTRLDVALPRPVLLRVWETSGGNPFFALELTRALKRRSGGLEPGEDLPLPSSLEALVHDRLDGLGASALAVARAAAALADPTVAVVEAAAGPRAERGLAEALAAGVLELDGERLRFTHPLLGSAVSSRSTPSRRRLLHRQLAQLAPSAEERAQHLALGATGASRVAASALDEAAASAYARGAPAVAAELAEQALQLTPATDAEEVHRRRVLAADRLLGAGDLRRAIDLLEQARAAAPPGHARAAILVQLAVAFRHFRGPGSREALAFCQEALAEAEGDDELEARVQLQLADLMRFVEDASRDRGLEHCRLAVAAARRAGDPDLLGQALAVFATLHFVLGRGVPQVEMAEALELERAQPTAALTEAVRWNTAHHLTWSGDDPDRGRRHLDEYRNAMRARDDPKEIEPVWALSVLEWRAGDWDRAAQYARELLSLGAQQGLERPEPVWDLAPAAISAYRGETEAARVRSEGALARAVEDGNRRAQAMHLWVLGFIERSTGDPAAALAYLRPAWEIYDELGYFEPGHRLELADTLEALIAVGELDEAERRLAPWEERAMALDRTWAIAITARCRGLLRAALGDLGGAFVGFDKALAEHARSVYPFEHARTLLALGATQRRARRRAAARATLERALAIFDELGAPLWAAQARAELARIAGRAPSRGELTGAERRIADLVAQGRTNREVADALFLTEHTVEATLTRVYRKLSVRSRTELANRLVRKTQEPSA